MFSAIQKEVNFNSSCYAMARNNVSQAVAYIKTVVTSIFARSTDDSISLKNRCTNLAKASGLLARVPLLCIPFINRATQLALRLLSPKLSVDSNFSQEELSVRYSEEALHARRSQVELNAKPEEGPHTESEKELQIERMTRGKTYIQAKKSKGKKVDFKTLKEFGLSNQEIQQICKDMAQEIGNFKKNNALRNLLKPS